MLRYESTLAWRHLIAGGWQTVLIVVGVAMAVTLVIFVSGLIYGLQQRIITTILGSTSQVTVTVLVPFPFAPKTIDGVPIITKATRRPRTLIGLQQWQTLGQELSAVPGVRAVAPEVTGEAIVTFEGTTEGAAVFGVVPEQQDQINHVSENMISGNFFRLGLDEIIIDYQLAQKLGVATGDRVSLTSGQITKTFRVNGIFFSQRGVGGGNSVYMLLRDAQALFRTGTSVTDYAISLTDVFQANAVADRIQASFQVQADSWMRLIPQLMSAFSAQSATALLIATFSLVASGFAIASVLIVSVLKRSREIGILKAMGARDRQILLVFIMEGLGIAIAGATLGALAGSGLIVAVRQVMQPAPAPGIAPQPLLPGVVSPQIILITMLASILITALASALPARNAAKLNPVEVIQRG